MTIGIGLAIALDPTGPPWLGGVAGTAGAYLVWLMGWQSYVRLRPDGVVLASMFWLAFVPWERFKEFRVANGLQVVTTDDRAIGSLAFGGSLAGQVTGYRRMRRVAERMDADRRALVAQRDRDGLSAPVPGEAVSSRHWIHFPVWPILAMAVPLELIGLLTTLLR